MLPTPSRIIEVTGAVIGKRVRKYVIGWSGLFAKKGTSMSGIIPAGIMKKDIC